jgi:hypothetical protein
MPTAHRPWHRGSLFGPGPRMPLDRERRAVWKARIEIHRRARRITDGESYVALALLRRLGHDGRCDPSHETLADDSGESVSTVKRALKALAAAGVAMLTWARRLVRAGRRVVQTSNAYLLTLGKQPEFPVNRCEGQHGRATSAFGSSLVQQPGELSPAEYRAGQKALMRAVVARQSALNLGRTARPVVPGRWQKYYG